MKYRKLANTNLDVSVICLGTMTYGEQNTQSEAHEQLDYSIANGINLIDTAEMYAIPPKEETQGLTEKIIGTWLAKRKDREKIYVATKVAGPGMEYLREGSRLDKKQIFQAVDDSLKRLQTDYIDLYQVHWPERKSNYFGRLGYEYSDEMGVSIEETLEAMTDLVKSGRVRYIGISNETPWGTSRYLNIAKEKSMEKIVTIQNPYSLLNRIYEVGLAEISKHENVGLLAYSPLGFGQLTGKYINKTEKNSRLGLFGDWFTRYSNEECLRAVGKYSKIADKYNLSLTHLALAFVNTRPFVTSNIIGATTMEQLKENIDSVNIEITETMLEDINQVHSSQPNPAP
ncbi:MAG: NADP(H)-dependent aldo-keto reductase [Gammaproteobacteria bacterium]|nr:NADP(H)-dependent aldo-keto reductase [Gammaproteobacteria bacterium]